MNELTTKDKMIVLAYQKISKNFLVVKIIDVIQKQNLGI